MSNQLKFPKLKKKISSFINDEDGTVLRSKAAVAGPVALGTVLLMSKEMAISAEASKFVSHLSHSSHSSSHASHSSHSNSLPSHTSHSSGTVSGFSHTAATFAAEVRTAENN